MAKNIMIDVKFNPVNQTELDSVLSKLENNFKLNLDTKAFTSSLNEMSKALDRLKSQLSQFDVLEKVDTSGVKSATANVKDLTTESEKMSSVMTKVNNSTGKVVQNITTYKNGIGATIKVVDSFNKSTGQLKSSITNINTSIEKVNKLKQTLNEKLDSSSVFRNLQNIDTSVIDNLRQKINSIKTDTSEKEINELKTAIKNLGSSDSQIVRLQSKILSMESTLSGLKGKFGDIVGGSSSVNQLKTFQSELSRLKQMLEQTLNGNTINKNALKSALDSASNASKNLSTAVESTAKSYQAVQKEVDSLQEKLNKSKNADILDKSKLADLQRQLNAVTKETDLNSESFKKLKSQIEGLGQAQGQVEQLKNSIAKLDNAIAKSQTSGNSLISQDSIDKAIQKSNELKRAMENVQRSGQAIAQGQFNTYLRDASTAMSNLTTSSMNFSRGLQNILSSMGIFVSSAMMFRAVWNELKEGVGYVKELDSAFRDISITTSLTKVQFNNITSQVQDMAKELGTSATAVMDVVKTYANASVNMSEVMEKIQPSIILSNISGMSTTEVTKAVQSATNAFKLLEKEGMSAEEATTRFGDTIVAVSQNMQYDFAEGVRELVSAISSAGSVAEVAGVSMESFASIVGAVIERTGKSGLTLWLTINSC